MAAIHHQGNQPDTPTNSSTTTCNVWPEVHSSFPRNESYGVSYPINQWSGVLHHSYVTHGGFPPIGTMQNYPQPFWPQCMSTAFDNKPTNQQHEDKASETRDCSISNQFPQQPSVSDLSVNPFQDSSELYYSKKPLCLQESSEFSPVAIPASSANDEILDVGSFSPFGCGTDAGDINQTNLGPGSTSSAGYSSGYQSCEGSTDSSPLRPLNDAQPLVDLPPNPVDHYQPDLYPCREAQFQQCSPSDLSPVMAPPVLTDWPSVPASVASNPASVQSIDQPGPSTTVIEIAEAPLPSTEIPEKLANETNSQADDTQVKKSRVKYTSAQLEILEKAFTDTPYPDWDEMEELSRRLEIAEQKIKVWFQNKRARWRKKQTAQQLQKVAAFKPLPQMSALYRFPSSAQNFLPPTQKPGRVFPTNAPGTATSMYGQHYPTHPSCRPHPANPSMYAPVHGNQFEFPRKPLPVQNQTHGSTIRGPSSACYQPQMTQSGYSGLQGVLQPNYGNYGNLRNNFMYPHM